MVTVKVYATSEEDVNILKKGVTVSSLRGHRPDAIVPTGLDPARQWYLYESLDVSVQQTKQRTLPVQTQITKHTLNLHSILCITYITSHSFGVNVVAMNFFWK